MSRFRLSPEFIDSKKRFEDLMEDQGLDLDFESRGLAKGDPKSLGLYLADCVIAFGLSDGSNESNAFENQFYEPVNEALNPSESGTPGLEDPNRWQPLEFSEIFVGQGGFTIGTNQPSFLGAEWGNVIPFAIPENVSIEFERDGNDYRVYHDPGNPALLTGDGAKPDEYQWTPFIGGSLVLSFRSNRRRHVGYFSCKHWKFVGNSRVQLRR